MKHKSIRRHNYSKCMNIAYCVLAIVIGFYLSLFYFADILLADINLEKQVNHMFPEYDFIVYDNLYSKPTLKSESTETAEQVILDARCSQFCDISLSETDINTLATLVYLEAGGESYECQKAVASVVLNRMHIYGKSLLEVVYEPGQFTPANLIDSSSPSDSCLDAVNDVLTNGTTLPMYVTFFRGDHYHKWDRSRYIPYCKIDNTYFTYDSFLIDKCEGN